VLLRFWMHGIDFSAPPCRSGPYRFDLSDGKWVYHRDGSELLSLLEDEFFKLFDVKLHLQD
jgi:frataxin-like iron-binding protein CyaY